MLGAGFRVGGTEGAEGLLGGQALRVPCLGALQHAWEHCGDCTEDGVRGHGGDPMVWDVWGWGTQGGLHGEGRHRAPQPSTCGTGDTGHSAGRHRDLGGHRRGGGVAQGCRAGGFSRGLHLSALVSPCHPWPGTPLPCVHLRTVLGLSTTGAPPQLCPCAHLQSPQPALPLRPPCTPPLHPPTPGTILSLALARTQPKIWPPAPCTRPSPEPHTHSTLHPARVSANPWGTLQDIKAL